MTSVSASSQASRGNRTLPHTLDALATVNPTHLYASIPRQRDISHEFLDVSFQDMSRCVNFMSHWIALYVGKTDNFETLAYMGVSDLRDAAIFLAAVKCGYKVLLLSPQSQPDSVISLMQQTQCTKMLYPVEVTSAVDSLAVSCHAVACFEIPSFTEALESTPEPYLFEKSFADVQNDPIVVFQSSGPTGLPKPIIMTHASFATLDRERHIPTIAGHANRDYSIWDFDGGGRFFTVYPCFHLAGFLSLLINPIFTKSSPVLGPPHLPPSVEILKEVITHQNLRAVYLPPLLLEQLALESGGVECLKDLDFVAYTGGPIGLEAEQKLSEVTQLIQLYGSVAKSRAL